MYLDCQVYDINGELQISFDAVMAYYQTGLLEHVFAELIHALQTTMLKPRCHIGRDCRYPEHGDVNHSLTIVRADPLKSFPLTELQQAYAFGKTAYGGEVATQVYSALRVKHLDLARLQAALAKLIANHVMLRAVIGLEGQQKILASVPDYRIKVDDLRLAEPEQQQAAIAKIERDMLMRNGPLGDWPHFELRVSLLDHEQALIHFSVELLIADALSLEILRADLCRFYQQPEADLTPRDLSYADYCLSVKHYEQTLAFQHSQAYWQQKFSTLPSGLHLARLNSGGHIGTVRLDAVLTEWPKIKQYAQSLNVPPSVVLLTAYAKVLSAWSDGQAFSIVIPSWQRLPVHPDINHIVGDFTRLAWLPVNPQQTLSFTEHVLAVHAELQRDFAEAPASGLSVLRKQALKPAQRRSLKFPIVFTDLVPEHESKLPAEFSLTKTLSRTAHVDIDNISTDHGDTLGLHWDVAEAVYAVADVELMFKEYWGVCGGGQYC
ncbi:condensation domain-containing protein [Methylocucumis oryzae]|uniref:Condensation domain-containing protein n=1 Tax=Methylocucumis oryzae TaxID=1632867 RepID=A0A0F3IMF9_9GAMM|nr:condensation domain-containing protein [Methylocucumis oryzae]KJV07891.1 hypothetical protein VZ94_01560 [Methylocucumis oryzae]